MTVTIRINGIPRAFDTVDDDSTRTAPFCPRCGAPECHPTDKNKALVRGFKVHDQGRWWSQCLVCAGYYNSKLEYRQEFGHANRGWFA